MVLENVAFAGDILLRLPDISHALLRENSAGGQWRQLLEWGVLFCNDTMIFSGKQSLLLKAIAQELNLADHDPDYVNPYKQENREALAKESEAEAAALKKSTTRKTVKEKKKTKGPRMSSARHDDL